MTLGDLGKMLKSPGSSRRRSSVDPPISEVVQPPATLIKRGSYKRATTGDGSGEDERDVLGEVAGTVKKTMLKRMSSAKRW